MISSTAACNFVGFLDVASLATLRKTAKNTTPSNTENAIESTLIVQKFPAQ